MQRLTHLTQWIFIIFGLVTFVWGIVLLIFLPDSPLTARFLTEEERKFAHQRPQAAQKSYKSTSWRKDQFIEALIDPKTWFLFVYNVMICLPNGGLTNVSNLHAPKERPQALTYQPYSSRAS